MALVKFVYFLKLFVFPLLSDPEFIGSFELNDTVLFFFREEAVEVDQKNPRIYSRVAKVCKVMYTTRFFSRTNYCKYELQLHVPKKGLGKEQHLI